MAKFAFLIVSLSFNSFVTSQAQSTSLTSTRRSVSYLTPVDFHYQSPASTPTSGNVVHVTIYLLCTSSLACNEVWTIPRVPITRKFNIVTCLYVELCSYNTTLLHTEPKRPAECQGNRAVRVAPSEVWKGASQPRRCFSLHRGTSLIELVEVSTKKKKETLMIHS